MFKSLIISYLYIFILLFLFNCGEKNTAENLEKGISKKDSIQNKEPTVNNIEEKKDVKPQFPVLDTIFKDNGLIIKISSSQKNFLQNPFIDSEIIFNKICDTIKYENFPVAERAEVIEKYSLEKDEKFVTRKNSDLIFKLKNGKFKKITNINYGDGDRSFYYREYLKEIGFFVCFVAPWEGASYMLINDQTGEEFRINGIPKISKDKKRILTTPYDAGYYFNDWNLNIWKITKNKIKQEFSYFLGQVWNAEWIDNQIIRFEVLPENQNELECFGKDGMETLSVNCKKVFELKITEK